MSSRRTTVLVGLACLLTSLIVYSRTLAPTVTVEDSGELIAAAVTLGVPHPPGYPLWTILAHVFSLGTPGNRALGPNFMSAVFGSLTILGCFHLGRELGLGLRAASAASLLFGFSRTFWSQAVIAEVYTLGTFLQVSMLLFLVRFRRDRRPRNLMLTAIAFGLSLTDHYMLALLLAPPAVAYLLWVLQGCSSSWLGMWSEHLRAWPWRTIAMSATLVAACLVIYAYLPWAATHHRPMNWGDPSTLDRLAAHVTRRAYRSLELETTTTLGTKVLFLGHFASLLLEQFTPYVLLGGLLAAFVSPPAWSAERGLLAGLVLFNGPVLIGILHFTFEAENRSRVEEYYLMAWMCTALLLMERLAPFGERLPRDLRSVGIFAGPTLALLVNFRENDLSKMYLARDFNETILRSFPPNAVFFPGADYNSFPCIYLQAVERIRPDVLLMDVTGEVSEAGVSYLRELGEAQGSFTMADAQAVLLTKSTRPIFFAGRNDVKISPPPSLRPWGWTYRLVRDDSDQAEAPAVSTRRNLRNMATADLDTDDLMARGLIANALLMDAEVAAERRDLDAARLLYRDAARYARGSKETLNNVGSTLAGRGFVTEAEELFRAAADDYPGYVTPRRNLANLLRDQGRPAEAEPLLEEIQELIVRGDLSAMEAAARIAPVSEARPSFGECAAKVKERPEDPSAWNNLGSAHAERGEMDEAKVAFEKALALDPSNPTPYRNLSLLYEKMNDPVRARTYQGMYESRKTAR